MVRPVELPDINSLAHNGAASARSAPTLGTRPRQVIDCWSAAGLCAGEKTGRIARLLMGQGRQRQAHPLRLVLEALGAHGLEGFPSAEHPRG